MDIMKEISVLEGRYQYGIDSLAFVLDYVRDNFPHLEIKSVSPYSFTLGSSWQPDPWKENIGYGADYANCLFYGHLSISINPNSDVLADELIELRYRSYWNKIPFWKRITRKVEIENLINESTVSVELFDRIDLSQLSASYDLYVTFKGFKLDVI